MPTATVFLSADTKAPEGMSRMANARTAVKEFGHAVIIFNAAATRWVPRLTDAGYKYHRLFKDVRRPGAGRMEQLRADPRPISSSRHRSSRE